MNEIFLVHKVANTVTGVVHEVVSANQTRAGALAALEALAAARGAQVTLCQDPVNRLVAVANDANVMPVGYVIRMGLSA